MGMSSPNPISILDITALLSLQGIASPTDKAKYLRTTQRLDRAYRGYWHDTQPKK